MSNVLPPVRRDLPDFRELKIGDVIVHVVAESYRLERSEEPGVFDRFTLAEAVAAEGPEYQAALALEVARQVLSLHSRLLVEARESKRAKPEDDDRLCQDAARQWLKTSGQDRTDRAIRAVSHVLENNDYDQEYSVSRDKAAPVVKRGLALLGKASEWPERRYPKNRKSKLPPIR